VSLDLARAGGDASLKAGNGFLILAAVACCDLELNAGVVQPFILVMISTPRFGSIPAGAGWQGWCRSSFCDTPKRRKVLYIAQQQLLIVVDC
jgi:hypothetical protein